MNLRRLLAVASGGAAFAPVRVPTMAEIRAIVGDITAADGFVYDAQDTEGRGLHTIKIVDDGAGNYVGIHHWATLGVFEANVVSSPDLETWTHEAQLGTNAALPDIARRADGSFVVAWQTTDTGRLRVQRYADLAALFAASVTDDVLLPLTLATGSGTEQVPNFYDPEEPMDIGFAYNDGTIPLSDTPGRGTLVGLSGVGYTSWAPAQEAALDAAIRALDSNFAVGDKDHIVASDGELTFVEAQHLVPGYGAFQMYAWDGAVASRQNITTHGGSDEHANCTVSIVRDPASATGRVLVVSLFLHVTGAAPGEAGPVIYWKAL